MEKIVSKQQRRVLEFLSGCRGPSVVRAGFHSSPTKLKLVKLNEIGDLTFTKRAPFEALKITNCEFNS